QEEEAVLPGLVAGGREGHAGFDVGQTQRRSGDHRAGRIADGATQAGPRFLRQDCRHEEAQARHHPKEPRRHCQPPVLQTPGTCGIVTLFGGAAPWPALGGRQTEQLPPPASWFGYNSCVLTRRQALRSLLQFLAASPLLAAEKKISDLADPIF